MSKFLLQDLNESQQSAVNTISGPLLILAGAGSGKTRVLTYRVVNLIENGISPLEILAVTFTNKAAKEMQGRIEKLLGNKNFSSQQIRQPDVGTFHSICVRILRQEIETLEVGYTKNFVIFDTNDTISLLKNVMHAEHYDDKEFKPKAILGHISTIKSLLKSPRQHFYDIGISGNRFAEMVEKIFPIYKRRLVEHNALDFDDLLQKTVEVFEKNEAVLQKYRNRWQHILVDEYQDTNFVQYRLIRLLADAHQNLCVVGDDHQSIYSFRGADFRNILDFEKDFPSAKVVKLEQNYRSTGNILKNANRLISFNKTGRSKNLWTQCALGEKLKIVAVLDEKEEGRQIAEKIKEFQEKGFALRNIAVLYRMNAQSRAIEESFLRHQIPYQIVGGVRFFDRAEIKDIIAYLRLIFNPRDDVAFLRIINVPARKIGPATLETLKKYAQEYNLSLFDILEETEQMDEFSDTKKQALIQFRTLIRCLQKTAMEKPISLILEDLIEKTDFLKWLKDGSAEGESRAQNVREIFSVAGRYDVAENSLAAFLEGVALISDLDNLKETGDSVTLMTIHAAKGLEFPIVFLPGWETNIFPSSSSQFSREQEEEERRLGYVAITRAEKHCVISYVQNRLLFGKIEASLPSKFLEELDESSVCREFLVSRNFKPSQNYTHKNFSEEILPQKVPSTRKEAVFGIMENETSFRVGESLHHVEFGNGTIVQISGDTLSVAFKGMGIKKIAASIAPIKKIL